MAGELTDVGTSYSSGVGLIFVFNLIVGTGALTMPRAFSSAGWLLSLILVTALAFTSYVTVTFVIESMAAANALLKVKAGAKREEENEPQEENSLENTLEELTPLLGPVDMCEKDVYEIAERVEMGQMASLFFNKVGVNIFYIVIAIYLYGDLAIYAAAVPKSLRDLVCTYNGVNNSHCNGSVPDSELCWETTDIDRVNAYRLFVAVFTVGLGPFVFFNVQKTKYLQYFTTLMRWFAFITMITLAVIRLAKGQGEGHPGVVRFSGVPNLFGVCVYSFMCHHSLPSLVTPIKNKSKLSILFGADYLLILGFYSLLSFTGIFTFSKLQDLYTLNFEPDRCGDAHNPITTVVPIQYILALFPVFTLSTNFPIIAVTLRNNLKALFYREGHPYPWVVDRIIFPLAALLPPVAVAIATADLEQLVGITGSYAGAGVQYFIPVFLVFCARRSIGGLLANGVKNKHASPFKHQAWLWIISIWAVLAIILVTANHILEAVR